MKKRIRDKRLTIMFSDEEWAKVQAQMEKLGFNNFSAFARRMLIGGLIIKTDMTPFEKAAPSIESECEKINSLAKRINTINKVRQEDIEQIKNGQEAIKNLLEKIESELE